MNLGILLIAGRSERFGMDKPKQMCMVNGKELFIYPLETMLSVTQLDKILVVTNVEILVEVDKIVTKYDPNRVEVMIGGLTRQQSVHDALKYAKENYELKDSDNVLIHDGARANVSKDLIVRLIASLDKNEAVIPVVKVQDSLSVCKDNLVYSYLNRDEVYNVQTPQAFKFQTIWAAHEKAINDGIENARDDGSLVLNNDVVLKYVDGQVDNVKVTYPQDLNMVKYR